MKNLLLILLLSQISIFSNASELVRKIPSPDTSLVDSKVDPCENFYQYSCGNWLSQAKIPSDRPLWDRSFSAISERNKELLRETLESYANGKIKPANPYAQKLGDFYASCMDTSKLESTSVKTFKKEIQRIESVNLKNLSQVVGWMHLRGMSPFFYFSYTQDFKNPQEVIAEVGQSGLSLPTREYYLSTDSKMVAMRKKYLNYLQKMLKLSGVNNKTVHKDAEAILKLETRLAEASLAPVEMRDPKKLYHRTDKAALLQAVPVFNWDQYLKEIQMENFGPVNNSVPGFLTHLNEVLKSTPLSDIKAYLRIKFIEGSAKALSDKYYNELFSFYGRTLNGIKEPQVRWKRCVDATNESMSFALGRSFVDLTFAGPSKAIAQNMILDIEKSQGKVIESAAWMDAKTKESAQEKLKSLANQIGYPDVWRSYDQLEITRASYLENRYNSVRFNRLYHLAKIGKPLDRTDWDMAPSEVNAYYDPQMTKIVFPAGILQPPFFNADYMTEANFGGIGMVMGHEITHGFDDQGRQFDSVGAMRDWWTPKAAEEFQKRASCLADQYDAYTAAGGGHVNGKLTLGENIADQGGIKISFLAWKSQLPEETLKNEKKLKEEEKNFFISFAQSWCGKATDAYEQVLVNSNPHSPNRYRVNGPLSNFSEFANVFACKKGSKMVPEKQCVVW